MTRFETYEDYSQDEEVPRTVDEEYVATLEKNPKLLNQVQETLAKRYAQMQKLEYNNTFLGWWIKTFAKDFRDRVVHKPENAVLLKDYDHAKTHGGIKEGTLELIEERLYQPEYAE